MLIPLILIAERLKPVLCVRKHNSSCQIGPDPPYLPPRPSIHSNLHVQLPLRPDSIVFRPPIQPTPPLLLLPPPSIQTTPKTRPEPPPPL